jgi:hypothetical protein
MIEFGPSSLVDSYGVSLPGPRVPISVQALQSDLCPSADKHVCAEDGETMMPVISRHRYITRPARETRLASLLGLICLLL